MKRNVFGQLILLKKLVIRTFAFITYIRFNKINHPNIKGAELFQQLPSKNVLFVSNHQTYFADVAFMIHAMETSLYGYPNQLKLRGILACPFVNFYFVAAEETMKSGLLPKILAYAGAITIKRTWREAGKEIKRPVDQNDTEKIKIALENGWVVNFPQGTTKPYAEGRKGTAHLIKNYKPLVIPIVINGFRRAFDKKGLLIKKRGTTLEMTVKPPLTINYDNDVETILHQVMLAIEQVEHKEK
ncbi:MAG: 1-acyl-sn-glycerol-3-phosphate acyltransferase [Bacteroidetes bacterium HGW-Bacteroidetes-12]|nr:MAG: 1-acyl-sn-glycerol-3-phosphate acyltransferase [Bacteroidetes bacterium HGW-Bacteroidetes-12]